MFAIAAFLYEYVYKVHRAVNFYKEQGVTIGPGVTRPLIGDVLEKVTAYNKAAAESDEPLPFMNFWSFKTSFAPDTEIEFFPERHKAALSFIQGKTRLLICDPDIAQDIFVTKNRLVDKTGDKPNKPVTIVDCGELEGDSKLTAETADFLSSYSA